MAEYKSFRAELLDLYAVCSKRTEWSENRFEEQGGLGKGAVGRVRRGEHDKLDREPIDILLEKLEEGSVLTPAEGEYWHQRLHVARFMLEVAADLPGDLGNNLDDLPFDVRDLIEDTCVAIYTQFKGHFAVDLTGIALMIADQIRRRTVAAGGGTADPSTSPHEPPPEPPPPERPSLIDSANTGLSSPRANWRIGAVVLLRAGTLVFNTPRDRMFSLPYAEYARVTGGPNWFATRREPDDELRYDDDWYEIQFVEGGGNGWVHSREAELAHQVTPRNVPWPLLIGATPRHFNYGEATSFWVPDPPTYAFYAEIRPTGNSGTVMSRQVDPSVVADGRPTAAYSLRANGGGLAVQHRGGGNPGLQYPGVNPFDGNWHSAKVTFDGQTLSLYVDGVLGARGHMPPLQPRIGPLLIGKEAGGGNSYSGDIRCVSFGSFP